MQENVRFFYTKLHKNAYFSVCKVHKIAKSVISTGQKDQVEKGKRPYSDVRNANEMRMREN